MTRYGAVTVAMIAATLAAMWLLLPSGASATPKPKPIDPLAALYGPPTRMKVNGKWVRVYERTENGYLLGCERWVFSPPNVPSWFVERCVYLKRLAASKPTPRTPPSPKAPAA